MPARAMTAGRNAFIFFAIALCAGCGGASKPAGEPQIGWRPIFSSSGNESVQTDSFNIESTQWRIKWKTTAQKPTEAGSFMIRVHSSISGRPLVVAVEPRQGAGSGIAYVTEDPRLYHLIIESSALDWSIQVEEAVVGVPRGQEETPPTVVVR